ncbi:MAG: inositol monophosphatase [Candidatus Saccharimonadales bacterium]
MTVSIDFLHAADKRIRVLLQELRPQLLEAHGAIEHKIKDDKTVVTQMDLLVEERLKAALSELAPDIAFSGEETGTDYDQKTFWLVDPIDGTESFVRGLPFSTNMIALIDDGEPVLSVIYNFFLDEYYLAIKGHGATCNGHPIHVSDRPMKRANVVSGSGFGKAGLTETNDRLRKQVAAMSGMNASGFEMSAIARGALDGRITWNPSGKAWDFAPGALLIQEAGGRVENIGAKGYDYRNLQFIASNPLIFDDLMKFVLEETAGYTL